MNKLRSLLPKYFLGILFTGVMFLLSACDLTQKHGLDLQKMEDVMNSVRGCFSCQFFTITYNSIAHLTETIYPRICSVALSVLAIGLFGWILWHVFSLLITLREPNLSQFWLGLFQTLFKGGFVAILIRTKESLYQVINTIMEPIALIFIEFGHVLLQDNWTSSTQSISDLRQAVQAGPGFPSEMGSRLVSLIYRITVTLNIGRILGVKIMLGDDLTNIIVGFITTCIFFLMTLFFPFYLLDGLFRLSFVFVLLPFFLVGWVFKKTESYIKTAWSIFIGAFAQILAACVFVAICIATLEGFININGYSGLLSGSVQEIDQFVYLEADQLLYPFISFVFVAFYMYNLSKRISSVTSHFTGAPASNMVSGAINRIKSAIKAFVLTTTAVAATAISATAVATVAMRHARQEARKAVRGGGEEE